MAGRKKRADVVLGYDVVRTVARGGERPAPAPAASPPSERPPRAAPRQAAHIGRTSLPSRHEVACYHCGYEFHVLGRQQMAVCSRCHEKLDVADHAIEAPFDGVLTTAGSVDVKQGAVIRGGELTASCIRLAGRMEGGALHAMRELRIAKTATFLEERAGYRDLVLEAGTRLRFRRALRCRDLTVRGRLSAQVESGGLVRVEAGGMIRGSVRAPRLAVEDGGGLKARLAVGAPAKGPAA